MSISVDIGSREVDFVMPKLKILNFIGKLMKFGNLLVGVFFQFGQKIGYFWSYFL